MAMHWFFRKIANWPKNLASNGRCFLEGNQYLGGDFSAVA
jgi:hypothetical protein